MFLILIISLYIPKDTTVFKIEVGKTTVENKIINLAGSPTIIDTETRNTIPLTKVPRKDSIETLELLFLGK